MALASIILILSALTVLSVALIFFSTTELQVAKNYEDHSGALFVAEAGVSEVLTRMNVPTGTQVTVDGQPVDAFIGDDPDNPDPNWRVEIHSASPADLPSPDGNETVLASVQSSGSRLGYGGEPIVVEHKWSDRNGDGVRDPDELVRFDPHVVPAENFDRGNLVEIVTVTGMHNGSRRTVRAEMVRTPVNPRLMAPLSADHIVELKESNGARICGHNHDRNTPEGVTIDACKAWEKCSNRTRDLEAGCLYSVVTSGDEIKVKPGAINTGDPLFDHKGKPVKKQVIVNGFPAWSDTSSFNAFLDPHDALGIGQAEWDSMIASPDFTSDKLEDKSDFEGVCYLIDEDPSEDVKAELKESDGRGLLYVKGDLKIKKSTWRGLIYVDGDCEIGSDSWVLGGLMVRGDDKKVKAKKRTTILYSSDAITEWVRTKYKTLAWKEL